MPRFVFCVPVLGLLAGLAIGGCASSRVPSKDPLAWRVVPSKIESNIVVQYQLPDALASIMCAPDGCRAIIISKAQCAIGTIFPVLVNTIIDAGVTNGECIEADINGERKSGVVFLAEPNLLLPNIVLGDDAAIAVPMADGGVSVFVIPMIGLRNLLAPLKPDLFSPPDDSQLEQEDSDNEDALRWRRGLQAI